MEDGELSDSEMDDSSCQESDPEYGANPTGLFDALAAAQEAGERYKMLEDGGLDESCRLSENFLVQAFQDAIRFDFI